MKKRGQSHQQSPHHLQKLFAESFQLKIFEKPTTQRCFACRLSKKLFYRKRKSKRNGNLLKMEKQLKKNKHKAFIDKALCLLAFSVLALCRTLVRRRMQERKIYLPFSKSPSVSRLSRHAERKDALRVTLLLQRPCEKKTDKALMGFDAMSAFKFVRGAIWISYSIMSLSAAILFDAEELPITLRKSTSSILFLPTKSASLPFHLR